SERLIFVLERGMAVAKGLKVVGYFDCPGGGQVVVDKGIAYVGHMKTPDGTSIIDVRDPAKPRKLAEIKIPDGTLSHKVRVGNGIMLVNREIFPIGRKDPDFKGGLEIFDITKPDAPRHITTWQTRGMHRFTFDGRYVYGSPELDGYLGNVVSIIDFHEPERPEEVGRWWMPGQWAAGGPGAGGRRKATLAGTGSSPPPSDAGWHSPVCQLLARGLCHPRHRRHDQAEVRLRAGLEPAIPLADSHRTAGSVSAARPPRH